jgi:hypothetical protein
MHICQWVPQTRLLQGTMRREEAALRRDMIERFDAVG